MFRDSLMRKALKERFTITLKNGETFDGLLLEVDGKTVVFVDAYLVDGKDRHSVDGSLYVPRLEIIYMQRMAG